MHDLVCIIYVWYLLLIWFSYHKLLSWLLDLIYFLFSLFNSESFGWILGSWVKERGVWNFTSRIDKRECKYAWSVNCSVSYQIALFNRRRFWEKVMCFFYLNSSYVNSRYLIAYSITFFFSIKFDADILKNRGWKILKNVSRKPSFRPKRVSWSVLTRNLMDTMA